MSYLLDTCVVSDFVKGEENTLKRLKSSLPSKIFISSITPMEVKYGLAVNPQRAIKIQGLIKTFLNSITILPFTSEAPEQAAQIRSSLKTAGTPVGAYDVLIAVAAITNNFILVTSNVREFQRVPNLQIENWRSS
ncbi:MAG: type II toxin-antitoxin system VapC family toxin [Nostocaceae cyanobacterium]|nr:type II toxin-antitoxin system VapC family toxin [Nostocaceae cyanobacterium]